MDKINIFWFRRDLRIDDNCGFYNILVDKRNVLSLFIFDKNILDKLNKDDKRVSFIYSELMKISNFLKKEQSSLLIKYGDPEQIFEQIIKEYNIDSVYTNHDYEPYAIERDNKVNRILERNNIIFKTFKDQVIFEKNEIINKQNNPYNVYTPYKNKWKETFLEIGNINYPSESNLFNLYKGLPLEFPSIDDIGFKEQNLNLTSKEIDIEIIKDYDKFRDIPSLDKTSKISLHLRFGTISIRKCIEIAQKFNDIWLNELIWREFFMMILFNYPDVINSSFKKQYDNIKWLNNESDFEKWCNGQTGYPIVDAGMRELNSTGYMHNRVRLITASFLTKHLLIDWRWGEKYFSEKLLDYELSSNNGNWQWCAGTGCDSSPYFRVFNPEFQTQKFDPKYEYIKKWVSELDTLKYPKPIIEHTFARNRALETYKIGLSIN